MNIKEVMKELRDYAANANKNRRFHIDDEHGAYFEGKAEAYEAAITLVEVLEASE